MDLLRKVLVLFIAILLVVGFSFATAGITAERTVLNSEFVKDTFDEEKIHITLHDEFISNLESDEEEEDQFNDEIGEILKEAISPDFIRETIHTNIDVFYEYMDGDQENLVLNIDIEETKDDFEQELQAHLFESDMTEINELIHGEEAQEHEVIHEYQGIEFTVSMVDQMLEDQESYEETIDDYRSDLETLVGEDQVDQVIEEAIEESREEIEEDQEVDETEQELIESYIELKITPLQSIANEDSYEEFTDTMEDRKTDLSSSYTTTFYNALTEEMPSEIDLKEELDEDEVEVVENAQDYLQITTLLTIILILVLVVLTTLIWFTSGSLTTTFFTAGGTALVASLLGILTYLITPSLIDRFIDELGEETPIELIEFAETFITNIITTHAIHSIILLAISLILIAIGIAIYKKK